MLTPEGTVSGVDPVSQARNHQPSEPSPTMGWLGHHNQWLPISHIYIYNIIYELEELLVYIYVYKFILVYIRQFITVNQVRTIYLFFASDLLIAARGVSISCGRTPPTSGWPWEAALRCCDLSPKWLNDPLDPDDFMKFCWENDEHILS